MRLLRSILAPTWHPRTLHSRPRVPKSRPRQAKSCPRNRLIRPGAPRTRRGVAQEAHYSLPRACQEPTKMPRSSPGLAQDPPRISQNRSRPNALPATSKEIPASPRNPSGLLSKPRSDRNQKRAAAVLPPEGVLNPPPNWGRRVERGYEVFLSFRILLPDSSSQRFLSSPY